MDITDPIDVSFFCMVYRANITNHYRIITQNSRRVLKRHNTTRIRFGIRIIGRSAVLKSVSSPINNIMQVKR